MENTCIASVGSPFISEEDLGDWLSGETQFNPQDAEFFFGQAQLLAKEVERVRAIKSAEFAAEMLALVTEEK